MIGYKIYEYCTEFRLDNVDKYLVRTNMNKSIGGSQDNIYYGIDLGKAKITKYDEFNGMRFIHNRNLSENEVDELRVLFSKESLETYREEYIRDKEKQRAKNERKN